MHGDQNVTITTILLYDLTEFFPESEIFPPKSYREN